MTVLGQAHTYLLQALAHTLAVLTYRFWDVIALLTFLAVAVVVVL